MAELNQNPAHVRSLEREFKVRGDMGGLIVSSSISPVVILADLSQGGFPGRGYPRPAMGRCFSATGGAGTNVQATAVGVPGRGKIYLVDKVHVTKPTVGNVQIRLSNGTGAPTAHTAQTGKGYRDARVGGEVPDMFIGVLTPLTAALSGVLVGQAFLGVADEEIEIELGVVLGDATTFVTIANNTTDETMTARWYWREYLFEDA